MTDPYEIRQAVKHGNLRVIRGDWTMHLHCCATPKERDAAELCLGPDGEVALHPRLAARALGVNPMTVNSRLRRFKKKMRKHARK